ncbi:TlpA disulfide reductase family protein [Treponema primitia]|uniref:TlpA disulfide reductase family protein n=1 Tax=Treponema primitia TaxID=88058 RepID=UPI00025553D3|nr:TlpA disulfide reductase family protein [Treponema primitia]
MINKQFLCALFILGALLLFPQCVPAKGASQKNNDTTGTAAPAEEIDWDSLPEIDPGVKQAFEELGIPVVDRPIPIFDFSAELLDGSFIKLSDFKGKVVFLNFWATWCGPCRMEMPSMEILYRRFKDQGLEILAVDVRESKKDVAAFMDELDLSFPAALDPRGDIAAIYGIEAFPTTYIIGRDGRIITRLVGAINWDIPELIELFQILLKVPAAE